MFQWISSLRKWFSVKLHRFLGEKDVRGIADQAVEKSVDAIKRISLRLTEGQINAVDWREAVAEEIKDSFIQQYLLGKGGVKNMTDADWREVDKLVDQQYQFLEKFYNDIVAGKIEGGQLVTRASLYGLAVGAGFASAVAAGATNKTQEAWRMTTREHCEDCIRFAGMGWQPLHTFPIQRTGYTACQNHCGCYTEYR